MSSPDKVFLPPLVLPFPFSFPDNPSSIVPRPAAEGLPAGARPEQDRKLVRWPLEKQPSAGIPAGKELHEQELIVFRLGKQNRKKKELGDTLGSFRSS